MFRMIHILKKNLAIVISISNFLDAEKKDDIKLTYCWKSVMLKLSGVELFKEIEILAAGFPTKIVKRKNSAQSRNINIKNVYWTENQKV